MLAFLISFFSKKIYIKLEKDECLFYDGKNSIVIPTRVYYKKINNQKIIIAVGEYQNEDNSICINLFDKARDDKFNFLEKYFRYANELLHNRKSFISPNIIVETTKPLNEVLSGYEEYIIKEALLESGAFKIEFEDSNNKYRRQI